MRSAERLEVATCHCSMCLTDHTDDTLLCDREGIWTFNASGDREAYLTLLSRWGLALHSPAALRVYLAFVDDCAEAAEKEAAAQCRRQRPIHRNRW
jgi:hypothetical protein